MFDVQSTVLTDKAQQSDPFAAKIKKFKDFNLIEVMKDNKFAFELYQNQKDGKWFINRNSEDCGALGRIFGEPKNIIDVNSLFWIDCVQDAFICHECESGLIRDEDGFQSHACENCHTNAPLMGEN